MDPPRLTTRAKSMTTAAKHDDSVFAAPMRQPLTPPRTPERTSAASSPSTSPSPSQIARWDVAKASLSTPKSFSGSPPDAAIPASPTHPTRFQHCNDSPISLSSALPGSYGSEECGSPRRTVLRMDDVLRPRQVDGEWEHEKDYKGKPATYGSGGFSTVYKAVLRSGGAQPSRVVAIKVPQDRDTAAAVEREAKILTFLQPKFDTGSSAHHPFLVDFLGFDTSCSSIVLEGLPWNLFDFSQDARRTRKAGEPVVGTKLWLHFALRLVSGLKFMTDAGVIHGDIKPGNVLLRPTPPGSDLPFDPVYCDFTSSTLDEDKTGLLALTSTGGTTEFSSPELVRRLRGNYDSLPTALDDIFALGVTLFTPALGDNIYSAAPNRFLRLEWVKQGQPLRYIASVWKLPKGNVVEQCLVGAVAAEGERWSLEKWLQVIEEQWTALYMGYGTELRKVRENLPQAPGTKNGHTIRAGEQWEGIV